jgi:TonB family protein
MNAPDPKETKRAEQASDGIPSAPAWDAFEDASRPSWVQRHPVITWGSALAIAGSVAFFWKDIFPKQKASASRRENVVVINVPPPPPPPPPPPVAQPPPPPPEEKMIEQTPVENEAKPAESPDEPPAPDIGTNIAGDGPPDAFGLAGRNRAGTGTGTGATKAQQRSRWGWYASQVQSRIQSGVRNNRTTRAANLRADVKIWADSTGRVTRAAIASSTGNAALDAALRDQVLTGLQLSEPPPEGMPMPIVLRVTARRP